MIQEVQDNSIALLLVDFFSITLYEFICEVLNYFQDLGAKREDAHVEISLVQSE